MGTGWPSRSRSAPTHVRRGVQHAAAQGGARRAGLPHRPLPRPVDGPQPDRPALRQPALQPVWNAEHIERVEIVYDEDLTLEGRAGYYDGAGALRDMIQSHLLQVLAMFALESIASLDARSCATRRRRCSGPPRCGVAAEAAGRRARYTAGKLGRSPGAGLRGGGGGRPRAGHRDPRAGHRRGREQPLGRRAVPVAQRQVAGGPRARRS